MLNTIYASLFNLGPRRIVYIALPIFITSVAETLSIGSIIPIFYYKDNVLNYLSAENFQGLININLYQIFNEFYILFALAALLTLIILKVAAGTWSNSRLYSLVFELQKNISTNILKKNLECDYDKSIAIDSAELIKQSINDTTIYCHMNLIQIGLLCADCILILLIVGAIYLYDWKSALFLTVFNVIFFYLIYSTLKNKSVYWGNIRAVNEKNRISIIQAIKQGEREIRSLNTLSFFIDSFQEINDKISNSTKNQFLLNYLPRQFIEVIAVISILIIVIHFKSNNYSDQDILIALVGMAAMQSRLMPAISRSLVSLQNIAYSKPAACFITKEMLNKPINNISKNKIFAKDIERINIDNVTIFNSSSTIIKNLSYDFHKGKTYCITGKSGRGKSTLLNTIAGFNKSYTGTINFNISPANLPTNNESLAFLFLTQKPFTYESSIYNNISLGINLSKHDFENINIAARQLNLTSRIDFNNLETAYSPENYSGGENQRLSLIRCSLDLSDVILLDEPTSSLDANSEILFMNYINNVKTNKIIIIVSHSNYVKSRADSVLDLDAV